MSGPANDFLQVFAVYPWLRADWIGRIPQVPGSTDRAATLKALAPFHEYHIAQLGFSLSQFHTGEQVHGASIAEIHNDSPTHHHGVDGLMTRLPQTLLGIYVADCGAIYIVDPKQRAIALLHSGKVGTQLGILPRAIEQMQSAFQSKPEDLIVCLAPCIRPPAYDVDFAQQIQMQALAHGILPENFHDCGVCTSSDLTSFYSYRIEQGATGRMLALLGLV